MLGLFRRRWRDLTTGFWFYPGLVALLFAGFAFGMVAIDREAGPDGVPIFFGGSASAARNVLSSIAASLITVTGLAFSLTIVTLQLVSSQYTPRALRSFLGDRTNQLIAGTLVGIFAYCLLVLRSVRDEGDVADGFVPAMSVTIAIVFALVGLALILLFIHHMGQLIKLETITARITRETLKALADLYPEPYGRALGDEGEDLLEEWYSRSDPEVQRAPRPGYVQTIDLGEIGEDSLPEGTRLHVPVAPGEFVTEKTRLVAAWPQGERGREAAAALAALVHVDNERDVARTSASESASWPTSPSGPSRPASTTPPPR